MFVERGHDIVELLGRVENFVEQTVLERRLDVGLGDANAVAVATVYAG